MARLSPLTLIVGALVVLLAVFAWAASPDAVNGHRFAEQAVVGDPEADPVLLAAADALESAGTVTMRATAGPTETVVTTDFDGRADVEAPMPGVRRRLVLGRDVYEQLDDGTWIHPTFDVPPVFGQDAVRQLRFLRARVDDTGDGTYRLRTPFGEGRLEVGADGVPRRLELLEQGVHWEVVEVSDEPLRLEPPAGARAVDEATYLDLVAEAAATSR